MHHDPSDQNTTKRPLELVLYTGTQTLPFGPHLRAVPVSALWQA